MSTYGTPDFFRPPGPGGFNLGGSNGYTSGTITFFPQDVSAFANVLVQVRPTGVLTGWTATVTFYADQAATLLVEQFIIHSFSGTPIVETLPVVAQWMKVVVTAQASGGGQSANIWLTGFTGGTPERAWSGAGLLFAANASYAAHSGPVAWLDIVRSGPVWVAFWSDSPAFSVVLEGFTASGANTFENFRAHANTYPVPWSQLVYLGRYATRITVGNDDSVAHTLRIAIIPA